MNPRYVAYLAAALFPIMIAYGATPVSGSAGLLTPL
jgi:hypothetical protein